MSRGIFNGKITDRVTNGNYRCSQEPLSMVRENAVGKLEWETGLAEYFI